MKSYLIIAIILSFIFICSCKEICSTTVQCEWAKHYTQFCNDTTKECQDYEKIDAGNTTTNTKMCQNGLFDVNNVCKKLVGPGSDCSDSGRVGCLNSYCAYDGTNFICKAFDQLKIIGEGEDCSNISATVCDESTRCIDGTCRGFVGLGERCHGTYTTNKYPYCCPNLVCNLGICEKYYSGSEGAPADNALYCASGEINPDTRSCNKSCTFGQNYMYKACKLDGTLVDAFSQPTGEADLTNKNEFQLCESTVSRRDPKLTGQKDISRCIPINEDSCYSNEDCVPGKSYCYNPDFNGNKPGLCKMYIPYYRAQINNEYLVRRDLTCKDYFGNTNNLNHQTVFALCADYCNRRPDRRMLDVGHVSTLNVYDCQKGEPETIKDAKQYDILFKGCDAFLDEYKGK